MNNVFVRAGLIIALACSSGCVEGEDFAIEADQRGIIGGNETVPGQWPSVAQISTFSDGFGALCTATLIRPRILITAAHCVQDAIDAGNKTGSATFETTSGNERVSIVNLAAHRYYNPIGIRSDIGLVRLKDDAPQEALDAMFDFNTTPLTEDIIGASVHVVGFGVNDGTTQNGGGVQREIDLTVESLSAQLVGFGTPTRNICQGDSGGPTFFDPDGNGDRVIAVSSFGSNECMNTSFVARTDAFLDDFLTPILSSWDGPCMGGDGQCGENCVYPDPDCDICGFDGVCGQNCAQLDFDCPLATLPGGLCQENDDCEFKKCVPATDDPRVSYCTTPCDPAKPVTDECVAPLTTCVPGGDGNVCGFVGITPSTQGAPCDGNEDCRSGICDMGNRICVELCQSSDDCSAEYNCVGIGGGNSVCTFGGDGGGCCSVGNDKDEFTGMLLAFAMGLFFFGSRRRSRRQRAC